MPNCLLGAAWQCKKYKPRENSEVEKIMRIVYVVVWFLTRLRPTWQPKQNNADHAFSRLPAAQGLYDPKNEKDNCGVGMIANLKKASSHRIVKNALQVRNTV